MELLNRFVAGNPILVRIFKNSGILFSANILATFFGFISLILIARVLGVTQFGILALIVAYVTFINQLVNFQSWQALIKYGVAYLESSRLDSFSKLIKFGFLLDSTTAIIGTTISATGTLLISVLLGWSDQTTLMALIFSAIILFDLQGTPTAILRLRNRFDLLAYQMVIPAVIKVVAVGIAYFLTSDPWIFFSIWMGTTMFSSSLMMFFGWLELRKHGINGILTIPMTGVVDENPGLLKFVLITNLNSSIRMSSRHADILIVGGFLGPAGAGLYKVAKQFAEVLGKISNPLYQTIYPELARLWAQSDFREFRSIMVRSGIMAGAVAFLVWSIYVAFGKTILQYTVGPGYIGAHATLIWYTFAYVIAVASFPLQPAMLSMGRPIITLWVHSISTIIYFTLLVTFLAISGLVGAGIAYVGYYLIWSGLMLGIETKMLNQGNAPLGAESRIAGRLRLRSKLLR